MEKVKVISPTVTYKQEQSKVKLAGTHKIHPERQLQHEDQFRTEELGNQENKLYSQEGKLNNRGITHKQAELRWVKKKKKTDLRQAPQVTSYTVTVNTYSNPEMEAEK